MAHPEANRTAGAPSPAKTICRLEPLLEQQTSRKHRRTDGFDVRIQGFPTADLMPEATHKDDYCTLFIYVLRWLPRRPACFWGAPEPKAPRKCATSWTGTEAK